MASDTKQPPNVRVASPGTDWNIEKASKQCHHCKRHFVEEELYFSALYDEKQQFTRKDFCPPCWQGGEVGGEVFSFWKTRIPKADAPPKRHFDNATLLDFFLKLEADPDPEKRKLTYALALFLMRKKLLKYKDTVRDAGGQERLVLEYPQENKTFEVPNPRLTDEEIVTLTENLLKLFDDTEASFTQ